MRYGHSVGGHVNPYETGGAYQYHQRCFGDICRSLDHKMRLCTKNHETLDILHFYFHPFCSSCQTLQGERVKIFSSFKHPRQAWIMKLYHAYPVTQCNPLQLAYKQSPPYKCLSHKAWIQITFCFSLLSFSNDNIEQWQEQGHITQRKPIQSLVSITSVKIKAAQHLSGQQFLSQTL